MESSYNLVFQQTKSSFFLQIWCVSAGIYICIVCRQVCNYHVLCNFDLHIFVVNAPDHHALWNVVVLLLGMMASSAQGNGLSGQEALHKLLDHEYNSIFSI